MSSQALFFILNLKTKKFNPSSKNLSINKLFMLIKIVVVMRILVDLFFLTFRILKASFFLISSLNLFRSNISEAKRSIHSKTSLIKKFIENKKK